MSDVNRVSFWLMTPFAPTIALGAFLACGCSCKEKQTHPVVKRLPSTPDIVYAVVELEGHKWIATPQQVTGVWSLAGPLPPSAERDDK